MVNYFKTVFVALSLCFAGMLYSVSYREQHNAAQQAYDRGDFKIACDLYKAMPKKGAGAWYNLGTCYHAMDDQMNALVSYHRAYSTASFSLAPTAWSALQEAELKCFSKEREYERRSDSYETGWFARAFRSVPLLSLQLAFLCFWFAWWIFIFWDLEKGWKKKGLLLACSFTLASFLLFRYQDQHAKKGLVIQSIAACAGPNKSYDVIRELSPFQTVQITDQRPGWYKIQSGSSVGWVPADSIELI